MEEWCFLAFVRGALPIRVEESIDRQKKFGRKIAHWWPHAKILESGGS
jgi:hypothetical protein